MKTTTPMPPVPAGLGRIETTPAMVEMCEQMCEQVEIAPEHLGPARHNTVDDAGTKRWQRAVYATAREATVGGSGWLRWRDCDPPAAAAMTDSEVLALATIHTCPVRGRAVLGLFGWLRLIADAGHGPVDVDYDVEDDLVIGARARIVLADGGVFEHEITREDVDRRGAQSSPRLWAEHRDLIVRGFAIKEAAKAMARDGYIGAGMIQRAGG